MKISKRLKSLSKYIEKNDKIIDIGCDHALLDIFLIKENILSKIMISDINKFALNQGKKNINKYNLNNDIEARLGSGLEVLTDKDKIDTIVISGMGTKNILKILNNKYIKNINKLIIQSNNDYEFLRKEIIKLGFYDYQEEAVKDNNKLYLNIIFKRGKESITDIELKYGLTTMVNKQAYYEYLLEKYEKILKRVKNEDLILEINYLKKINS